MHSMVKIKLLKADITCCKNGSKWYQQNINKHLFSTIIYIAFAALVRFYFFMQSFFYYSEKPSQLKGKKLYVTLTFNNFNVILKGILHKRVFEYLHHLEKCFK